MSSSATRPLTTNTASERAVAGWGHLGTAIAGFGLFGVGFMLTVFLLVLGTSGESGWPSNGWTSIFLLGTVAVAVSMMVIATIATVHVVKNRTARSLGAWIEDVASMALAQNFWGFRLVVAFFD